MPVEEVLSRKTGVIVGEDVYVDMFDKYIGACNVLIGLQIQPL